nr:Protein Y106G6H.1 [Haemonchus contortus]
MRLNSLHLLLVLLTLAVEASDFKQRCRAALNEGRLIIEKNAPPLVQEELIRMKRKLDQRMEAMFEAELLHGTLGLGKYMVLPDGDTDATAATTTLSPCPAPNRTMFTTAAPPSTSSGTTSCSQGTTSQMGSQSTGSSGTGQTTTSGGTVQGSTSTSAPTQTATATPSSTGNAAGKDDVAASSITSSAAEQSTSSDKSASSTDSSGSSSSSPASGSTTQSGTTTSPTPTQDTCASAQKIEESSKPFIMPTMFTSDTSADPFYRWMTALHNQMAKAEEICDQPPIKDINSITEDQIMGFLSILSTAYPGPFCGLCDHLMTEMLPRLFSMRPTWEEDERYLMRLLYANVPSAKAICSTLAPACYQDYEARSRNITEAVLCMECATCMTVTNLAEHSFLLEEEMVKSFLQFLRSSLFHNTCAELCQVWQPLNLTLFPNGFTYDGCMNYLNETYKDVIDFATVTLRPEKFCSRDLQWCELNETPNIMHCLRELCTESLRHTPQTAWICSAIPDTPEAADKFLNVEKTKKYKTRQPYHDKYDGGTAWHDEL